MEKKTVYQLAMERVEASGNTVHNSFTAAGAGAVRSIDLANISEGDIVSFPKELKLIEQPISGSNNKALYILTNEGLNFYPSCLTRGANPLDGSGYVKPTGTAVAELQKYSSMDKFYEEKLADKKLQFTKCTTVITKNRFGGPEPTMETKVWQIDFAK